jgi:hypothetical protein
MRSPPLNLQAPEVKLTAKPVTLVAPEPPPIFPWLVVSDFFPPRCKPIIPAHYLPPDLVVTPRAWFPSIAECTAADGRQTLYHLADGGGGAMDYVVFARYNQDQTFRPAFLAQKALEVLWSPDGSRVAITVLTGGNNAAVLLLKMNELKPSKEIAVDDALRGYLPKYLVDSPQFLMALRWTKSGELVLRARGYAPAEPYAAFGYEVVVDTDRLDQPGSIRFLRGYTNGPKRTEKE